MNKLKPEDLHLLFDEPIYVLKEQIVKPEANVEHQEDEAPQTEIKVEEPQVELETSEIKEILIINEDTGSDSIAQDDETFLFKGLNALNIKQEDVIIHNTIKSGPVKPPFRHLKQIVFKQSPDEAKLYKVLDASGIAHLECHPISTILKDMELKKQFWLGLKSLFGK